MFATKAKPVSGRLREIESEESAWTRDIHPKAVGIGAYSKTLICLYIQSNFLSIELKSSLSRMRLFSKKSIAPLTDLPGIGIGQANCLNLSSKAKHHHRHPGFTGAYT